MRWLAAAVAAEGLAWLLSSGVTESIYAGFRVNAHLGTGGWVTVVLASLAAAAVARGRPLPGLPALALAGLIAHLGYIGVPQAQPDTVNYFVYAQRVTAAPLDTLLHWPAIAWHIPQGRFHTPFPLVPLLYGLLHAVLGSMSRSTASTRSVMIETRCTPCSRRALQVMP